MMKLEGCGSSPSVGSALLAERTWRYHQRIGFPPTRFIPFPSKENWVSLYPDFRKKFIGGSVFHYLCKHQTPLVAAPEKQQSSNGLIERQWRTIVTIVGKDRNNDLSMGTSPNMEGREGLGSESCLEGTRHDEINIRHRPRISYCEAANRGLTRDILRQQ